MSETKIEKPEFELGQAVVWDDGTGVYDFVGYIAEINEHSVAVMAFNPNGSPYFLDYLNPKELRRINNIQPYTDLDFLKKHSAQGRVL